MMECGCGLLYTGMYGWISMLIVIYVYILWDVDTDGGMLILGCWCEW